MPYKVMEKRREATRKAQHKWRATHREQARQACRIWQKAHKHPCPICGLPVTYKYTHCRKHRIMPRGDKSNNWKGGRVKDGRGYIRIYKPDHPCASKSHYVLEHILVWEQAKGKPIPDGWHIHHLNGITSDNRPVNLVAIPARKHFLIFQAKAKRIQELEALLNHQNQLL